MGAGVRQGLNYDGIRQIEIVLPPLAEQTAIADCIAKKSEKVDVLIANQEAQIEKLKADVADWKERYQELSRQLAEQKSKLDEYEHSIGIIRDSARGGSEEFSDIWKEVDAVQERGKALASEKEIGAKTKVPHRKKDRER